MNIDAEGYTREQITNALFDSVREVRYEYVVSDNSDTPLGELEIEDGHISYDSKAEVMRTFSGRVKKSDLLNLDTIDYRVTPWMCLMMPNGKEAKWPLGKFIIYPTLEMENDRNMIGISGFDLGKIALDDKNVSRFYVDNETVYTTAIAAVLNEIYVRSEITETESVKSFPQEWEIGTSKMQIINDLLKGINYNPLHFDENGIAICDPFVAGLSRMIDFIYYANEQSIIFDGLKFASDKYDIPNKWIRYTENPEVSYLISTYTNDSANSPYSTVNRGRTIVDAAPVDDIASQSLLDSYTERVAFESMQTTEKLEFRTLNMPGHGFRECLYIKIPAYNIDGKYIETAWDMDLSYGGQMSHICERVVVL